jgi:hypothetical protein
MIYVDMPIFLPSNFGTISKFASEITDTNGGSSLAMLGFPNGFVTPRQVPKGKETYQQDPVAVSGCFVFTVTWLIGWNMRKNAEHYIIVPHKS